MDSLIDYIPAEKFKEEVVAKLELLFKDESMRVRKAVAEHALQIWEIIGKETCERVFLPLFNELIHDEDKSVTLSLIANLGTLLKVINIDIIKDDLVEAWSKMLEVTNWREKAKLLQEFPNFAKILGKDHFTELFLDMVKGSLSDRIFVVRQNTNEVIQKWMQLFGIGWFWKHLLDYLYAFKSDQNYLHRQTPLFLIKSLGSGFNE
jgi:hypothetical protein